MHHLPLTGIRVVDLTVVWAGPYCTQLLADWGAEVIRLEPLQLFQPITRGFSPRPTKAAIAASHKYPNNQPGPRPWNRASAFNAHARNKLSMTIDLRRREGISAFERLIRVTDVMVENNPVSTLEKLSITYQRLRQIRPDIIMVRMPPYGLNGPYMSYRTLGSSLEAVIGHTSLRGYRDMDLSMTSSSFVADAAAGTNAAFVAISALYYRQATGKGQLVDMGQSESMIPYLGEAIMDCSMNGRVQGPLGNGHPSKAPHGCYPCRGEDRWVVIAIGSDDEWQALCRIMGNPPWCSEAKFATCLGRWHHQEELDRRLAEWTSDCDAYEVMGLLQREGLAAGPVMDERDLCRDPHLKSRGFLEELNQSETGTYSYPGLMWKSTAFPNALRSPPCLLGEHNEYIYRELLGYSGAEYEKLETQGHIGMDYPADVK